MHFQPEKVGTFLDNFEASKAQIRAFDGCEHLELLQDSERPEVFFTYSHWRDEEALKTYRSSELFKRTWAKTKVLFKEKPEAWSLEQKECL